MDKNYPSDMQPPPYDPYEDEIELMDYLKVLWRWKYLIFIGTLVCAITAAVVSLNMTKIYSITTVLQPGILKVTEADKTVYIDSPENIKTVIETGALNGHLLKNVQFPNMEKQPTSVEFKVTIPKNTNALEVVYETPYVDIGLQIMKNLNEGLLERYARLVGYYREKQDLEMAQRMSLINDQKATLDATKKEIHILDKTIGEMEAEVRLVKENTASLIKQREKFVSNQIDPTNVLSAILFTNTIQQNIALDKTSRDDLSLNRSRKETLLLQLETTQNKINSLEAEIKSIQFKKDFIQNIQINKPPRISESPVKPKTRLNVMLAGVVGLFLTVFLSFFVEYISKYRNRETDE
jgi:LPS O-antigen subunit length determinant protein (WzzB/FepE family)